MIPPATEIGRPAAAAPTELTAHEMARLRHASRWARLSAILGFVLAVLCGTASVGGLYFVEPNAGPRRLFAAVVAPGVGFASIMIAAFLLWRYAGNLGAFFTRNEPTLALAFRNLRWYFRLLTIVVALMTAWRLVTMLLTIYGPL